MQELSLMSPFSIVILVVIWLASPSQGLFHINTVLCFPDLLRCCESFDRKARGQLLDLHHQDQWCERPCAPVPREWIQCQCEREPRSRCVCWAVGCPSCPLKVLLPILGALAPSCLQGGSSLATSGGPRLWISVNAWGLQPCFCWWYNAEFSGRVNM